MGRGQSGFNKSKAEEQIFSYRDSARNSFQKESRTESVDKNIEAALSQTGSIKLWVDDDLEDRKAPEGWLHVQTVPEALKVLDTGRVSELSLDHDLGDDKLYGRGVDIVDFLCEKDFSGSPLWPSQIRLHTANPHGRDVMLRALQKYNQAYKLSFSSSQPILSLESDPN